MTDHILVTDNDVCLGISQSVNPRANQTRLGFNRGNYIPVYRADTHTPPGNTNHCEKFKSPQQRQNTILTDTDACTQNKHRAFLTNAKQDQHKGCYYTYNVKHTHTGSYRQTDMHIAHSNKYKYKTHRPAETHAGLLGDSHIENGAVCSLQTQPIYAHINHKNVKPNIYRKTDTLVF